MLIHSQVSRFVLNGADLMLPGVAVLDNLLGLEVGDVCAGTCRALPCTISPIMAHFATTTRALKPLLKTSRLKMLDVVGIEHVRVFLAIRTYPPLPPPVVRVLGNPLPFAVGRSLCSWEGIQVNNRRGRALEIVLCFNDHLSHQGMGFTVNGPNEGFLCNARQVRAVCCVLCVVCCVLCVVSGVPCITC